MVAHYASFVTEEMELGSSVITMIANLLSIMWNSVSTFFQMIGSFILWFSDFLGLLNNPVFSLGFSVVISVTIILVVINIVKGIV